MLQGMFLCVSLTDVRIPTVFLDSWRVGSSPGTSAAISAALGEAVLQGPTDNARGPSTLESSH